MNKVVKFSNIYALDGKTITKEQDFMNILVIDKANKSTTMSKINWHDKSANVLVNDTSILDGTFKADKMVKPLV